MWGTPEYHIWATMIQRCINPKNQHYKDYGGRGIKICDRWRYSFPSFLEDMGHKPFLRAEIDREENNGNYEPSNCRWTTHSVNSRNRRNNLLNWYTVRSIRRLYSLHKYTQVQLSKIYNLSTTTIFHVVHNKTWNE